MYCYERFKSKENGAQKPRSIRSTKQLKCEINSDILKSAVGSHRETVGKKN